MHDSWDHQSDQSFSPEWAEAANEGAGENQSWIRASVKLRLAEMNWARQDAAAEAEEAAHSELQEC